MFCLWVDCLPGVSGNDSPGEGGGEAGQAGGHLDRGRIDPNIDYVYYIV